MSKKVYYNLFFFKSIIILLAFQEHYVHYLNAAFTTYMELLDFPKEIQTYYISYNNSLIKISPMQIRLLDFFVYWVSHSYIFLLMFFNFHKTEKEFESDYKSKNFFGLSIIAFFFLESIIFGESLGDKLSPNPLMIWGILILIINFVYKYGQKLGLGLFTLFSYLFCYVLYHFNISNMIETFLKTVLHPAFYLDARIENFILTALIGAWSGLLFYEKKYKLLIFIFIGILVSSILFPASKLNIDLYNMENTFNNEKTFYSSIPNQNRIHLILTFVTFGLILLEKFNITIKNGFFSYIARRSLFLFILHKPLMLFLFLPLKLYWCYYFNVDFNQSYLEVFIYSILTIIIGYLLEKVYAQCFKYAQQ